VEDRFWKNESRVMNHEEKEKTKRNNCVMYGTIVPGIDVCVIYAESRVLEPPVNLF
jgi:hypothetical protein